jgi:hypothetical protein
MTNLAKSENSTDSCECRKAPKGTTSSRTHCLRAICSEHRGSNSLGLEVFCFKLINYGDRLLHLQILEQSLDFGVSGGEPVSNQTLKYFRVGIRQAI